MTQPNVVDGAPESAAGGSTDSSLPANPWPALWAVVIGFFMILLDNTIVSVATPVLLRDLGTDVSTVLWVTSAYLLAYAVPLLVTGRLGDRFGPRRIYLLGLALFTAASLACGLAEGVATVLNSVISTVTPADDPVSPIGALITARVLQGFGASLMTPQTMALITRTFPAASRGRALALWGTTAGVATLLGPVLGGVLTDVAGWEWIFIINVPVGLIGFVLAARLVPDLPTHAHSFDWVGVALSALGVFLLVFGLQEGERYDWGTITGVLSIPAMIGAGLLILVAFVAWQARVRTEPLVPLGLFRDRNFSLSNLAIVAVSFAITSMSLPFMFYLQTVRGASPTEAGLILVPMAVMTAVLAPVVGKLVDRIHPRTITLVGFAAGAAAVGSLTQLMTPDSSIVLILLAMAVFGVGNACLWAPLAATATRNLPMSAAGAGSGVYNTTRQVAAVLGSAAIAAAIDARLAANLPGLSAGGGIEAGGASGGLPDALAAPFARAMAESLVLPAVALGLGIIVVAFFARPTHAGGRG